jgi:hypothetical protein
MLGDYQAQGRATLKAVAIVGALANESRIAFGSGSEWLAEHDAGIRSNARSVAVLQQ